MKALILAMTSILFGGVPFGASEGELRAKINKPLEEQVLGDGSRALVIRESIAGREAQRKWVIRNGAFVEGILLFSFNGEKSDCERLQRDALSALKANYGAEPQRMDDAPNRTFTWELWSITLNDGSRIEQRMAYMPLTKNCSVGGHYFPPVAGAKAF